jgi:dipeptidyl aminopeptidase/acylaminoacyl peptidase
MGGSYGGYAALAGLTFTPDTFAAAISIVGPSNINTLLSTIPPYWAPMIAQFKIRMGDFTTEEGKKFLESRSPLTFVDRIKKPLLIGQGAARKPPELLRRRRGLPRRAPGRPRRAGRG